MTTDHTPPTDQTALRDRIAAAMYEAEYPGFDWNEAHEEDREQALQLADAVLAVLPPPADRAERVEAEAQRLRAELEESRAIALSRCRTLDKHEALIERLRADRADVLRAIADALVRMDAMVWLGCRRGDRDHDEPIGQEALAERLADAVLRRMADETQPTEHQPRRGDQFEEWLKAQRDACFGHASSWAAVDGLLDQYRLHADTGTPLGEHVCEGKTVGDCECLEQPAAGARQDGTQNHKNALAELLTELGELHTRTHASPLPKHPAAMGWQATAGSMAAGFARALHALSQVAPEKAARIAGWFEGPFGEGPDSEEHTDWLEREVAREPEVLKKWVEDGRRMAREALESTEAWEKGNRSA